MVLYNVIYLHRRRVFLPTVSSIPLKINTKCLIILILDLILAINFIPSFVHVLVLDLIPAGGAGPRAYLGGGGRARFAPFLQNLCLTKTSSLENLCGQRNHINHAIAR